MTVSALACGGEVAGERGATRADGGAGGGEREASTTEGSAAEATASEAGAGEPDATSPEPDTGVPVVSAGEAGSSDCVDDVCAWTGPFGCNCTATCGGAKAQADCGWSNSGTSCTCVVDGRTVAATDGLTTSGFACDFATGPCARYFP